MSHFRSVTFPQCYQKQETGETVGYGKYKSKKIFPNAKMQGYEPNRQEICFDKFIS